MIVDELILTVDSSTELLQHSDEMYQQFLKGSITSEEIEKHFELNNLKAEVENVSNVMGEISKTAKLWLGYQSIVSITRKIIRADRLANWALHLEALTIALPIYAACDHFNCTKSLYLYLQKMNNLKNERPEVYQHFQEGNFVVRRSDRYWAGLPADQVIEQTLMRPLKSSGGLTRGSGMSDINRAVWLLSMSVCSTYKDKIYHK